jgi:Dihydroxyacetone kinase
VAAGVTAASDGVIAYGKAAVGDKTMVDALVPFAETLSVQLAMGDTLADAWVTAAAYAREAAAATADLLPRMGRARPHAEKSLGTVDAGAYSFGLVVTAIGTGLAARAEEKK